MQPRLVIGLERETFCLAIGCGDFKIALETAVFM